MKTTNTLLLALLFCLATKATAQLSVTPYCTFFGSTVDLFLDDPSAPFDTAAQYCIQFRNAAPPFNTAVSMVGLAASKTQIVLFNFPVNFSQGDYEVIVRDTIDCATPVLTSCACISVTGPGVSGFATNKNPACNGGQDGTITVAINGGCPPYFSMGNPAFTFMGKTATATGLAAGNYQFTISDQGGIQSGPFNETLVNPSQIALLFENSTPATCDTKGSLTISGSGGTPPYSFTPGGTGNPQVTIPALAAGPHIVSMTDSKGCPSVVDTFTIGANQGLPDAKIAPLTTAAIACDTTSITLSGNSATPNASFSWLKNGLPIFDSIANSLIVVEPGSYSFAVRDPATGCKNTSLPTVISEGRNFPSVEILPIGTAEICAGDSILLTANCPTGSPFCADAWVWGGPSGFSSDTSKQISALLGGNYSVTATLLASGCTATAGKSVAIKPTPSLTLPTGPTILASGATVVFDWVVFPQNAVMSWASVFDNLIAIPTSGTGLPGFGKFEVSAPEFVGGAAFTITPELDGCIGPSGTVSYKIVPGNFEVFAPEIISPNGSPANQTWQLSYPDSVRPDDFEVLIFNRSGGKVAGPEPLDFTWDADGCPNGTYFYLIKKKDGSGAAIKGAVTVIGK